MCIRDRIQGKISEGDTVEVGVRADEQALTLHAVPPPIQPDVETERAPDA